ncbi:UDP-N-acetylglucosamine pyrophosphorylase [candidate division LCP-89 bacterium B3_LCP]|uniref:UDP-N-acetylglucosamine pyrophosphorylase n=1 Tax=candidate division LCP-89 bacterium B3_LCP TaxID=2012998 RepID=A0A532UY01_UNCL8|nr:MAG: UDP-N-acetylglucosamine pyrophosphorylase [candidate division LCP-89 bacterium B3_LCP]
MNDSSGKIATLIMAAGKGTRMKSDLPKVLHKLRGRAMAHYVVDTARELKADPIVLIIGHKKEQVIKEFTGIGIKFVIQEPQAGTGHAIRCAMPQLEDFDGSVMILSGDVPLIKTRTLKSLWQHHRDEGAAATVLTATMDEPFGYGRIIRQNGGHLSGIVEERDASDEIRKINEINSGIYVFEAEHLRRVLPLLSDDNDQKEYYLTDAVRLLSDSGEIIAAFEGNFRETLGINTVAELQAAEKELSG